MHIKYVALGAITCLSLSGILMNWGEKNNITEESSHVVVEDELITSKASGAQIEKLFVFKSQQESHSDNFHSDVHAEKSEDVCIDTSCKHVHTKKHVMDRDAGMAASLVDVPVAVSQWRAAHAAWVADQSIAAKNALGHATQERQIALRSLMFNNPQQALRIAQEDRTFVEVLPEAFQQYAEQPFIGSGDVVKTHACGSNGCSDGYQAIVDGVEYRAHFATEEEHSAQVNRDVSLQGFALADDFLVSELVASADSAVLAEPSSSLIGMGAHEGDSRVLVVRVRFADDAADSDPADNNGEDNGNGVAAIKSSLEKLNIYWQEASNGVRGISEVVVVPPVLTLPRNKADYNVKTGLETPLPPPGPTTRVDIMSDLSGMLASYDAKNPEYDYNPDNYDEYAVLWPKITGLSYAGISGFPIGLNGRYDFAVFAHEIGHNMGLGHASSYSWSDTKLKFVDTEYGDDYDVMGNVVTDIRGHYNVFRKLYLGWLDADEHVYDLGDQGGTYTIFAHDQGEKILGQRYALRMKRLIDDEPDSNRIFGVSRNSARKALNMYVEFRQNYTDETATKYSGVNNGVSLIRNHGFYKEKSKAWENGSLTDMVDGDVTDGKDDLCLEIGKTFNSLDSDDGYLLFDWDNVPNVHKDGDEYWDKLLEFQNSENPDNAIWVTPIAIHRDTVPASVDVVVYRGAFPDNTAPVSDGIVITDINGTSITDVNINSEVFLFVKNPVDSDGDELSYYWDIGDATFTTTDSSNISHLFQTAAGVKTIRCTVSDRKGGVLKITRSFTVNDTVNKSPVVSISTPVEGAYFSEEETVRFTAGAVDYEDGAISVSDNYTWYSTLDGVIGTGNDISTGTLSLGLHQITVIARDSVGATHEAQIEVYIYPSGAQVVTLAASADTFIDASSDDRELNFGEEDLLQVGSGNTPRRILVQWDIAGRVPTDSTIITASINVNVTYNASGLQKGEVYAMRRPWVENDVTWKTSDGIEAWEEDGAVGPNDMNPQSLAELDYSGVLDKDVSSSRERSAFFNEFGLEHIRGWQTDTASNNGFIVSELIQGAFYAQSKESGSEGPRLRIVYTQAENSAPFIVTAAQANESPVTSDKTLLSVRAGDREDPEKFLNYSWSVESAPLGAIVQFSNNGNNTAKNTEVQFDRDGTYVFAVAVSDSDGLATQTTVTVSVVRTLDQLTIVPSMLSVQAGNTFDFNAVALDQFGTAVDQTGIVWSVSGGDSIDSAGVFNAQTVGTYIVTVQLLGRSDVASVMVTAEANTAPSITDLADQSFFEDTVKEELEIVVDDAELGPEGVVVTAGSSDQSLIQDSGIIVRGSGGARYVTIYPVLNAYGTCTITLTASDAILQTQTSFTVVVESKNDQPVLSLSFDGDELYYSSQLSMFHGTIFESVLITASDIETIPDNLVLTVTETTTDGIFSDSDLTITPTATPGVFHLALTHQPESPSGIARVQVTVSDDDATPRAYTASFTMKVIDAIDPIADITVAEDSAATDVAMTLGDENVTLTVQSSDESLIENTAISLSGTGLDRTLSLTPVADAYGVCVITVTATPDGGVPRSQSFTVTITPVNDAPTFMTIADQTMLDNGTISFDVSVSDLETVVTDLTLSVASSSQPTVLRDSDVTITATATPGMYTVTLVHDSDVLTLGATTIGLTLTDDDAAALSTTEYFVVEVLPLIVAVGNKTTAEDIALNNVPITVVDGAVTLVARSSDQSLISDGNISITGDTSSRLLSLIPETNAYGVCTITVTATTGDGLTTSSIQFTVTVQARNDAPFIGGTTTVSMSEDGSPLAWVAPALLGTDPDMNQQLSWHVSASPSHGSARFINMYNASSLVYTPQQDWYGTDRFTILLSDGVGGSSNAEITVTVMAVDDAPSVQDQTISTREDEAVAFVLAANDIDSTITSYVMSDPAHGILVGTPPNLEFVPTENWFGTDSFTYTASSAGKTSAVATVSIHASVKNDAPVITQGASVSVTLSEDSNPLAWVAPVLSATDEEGDAFRWAINQSPTQGSATLGSATDTSTLQYVPYPNADGTDVFIVQVSDIHGARSTVEVRVILESVNDKPTVVDQHISVEEDDVLSIVLVGEDVDGDTLHYNTSAPKYGVLSGTAPNFVYTPSLNFSGTDVFTFTVSDGQLVSEEGTINMTITALNDAPIIAQGDALSVTMSEDGNPVAWVAPALHASDADNDSLTWSLVTMPIYGSAVLPTPTDITTLVYAPPVNWSGNDSFVVEVSDGQGASDRVTLQVTVENVNDRPIPTDQSLIVAEDVSLAILLSGIDEEGAALSYTHTHPSHGILTGTVPNLLYTPNANFNGTDTFTFTVNDGAATSADGIITVSVMAHNDAPLIHQGDSISVTMSEDSNPIAWTTPVLTASDVDGDNVLWSVTQSPSHGQASFTSAQDGRSLVYIPSADFNGVDQLIITASDGNGGTDQVTCTITVNAVADGLGLPELSLSNVLEDQPIGMLIGMVSSANPDGYATVSYSLTGNGADDNSFMLEGARLSSAIVFDFEEKSHYTIELQATDGIDQTVTTQVHITITDVQYPIDVAEIRAPISVSGGTGHYTITINGVARGNTSSITLSHSGDGESTYKIQAIDSATRLTQSTIITVDEVKILPDLAN